MKPNKHLKELDGLRTRLYDSELKRREEENRSYMMHLENRFLLLNFNLEAGRDTSDNVIEGMHGGWEFPTCQLRGHFLGHWLSAAAMRYHAVGDKEIKAKADAIVDELAECQKANGGQWAGPIPENTCTGSPRGSRYGRPIIQSTRYLWACWTCMNTREMKLHWKLLKILLTGFTTGPAVSAGKK